MNNPYKAMEWDGMADYARKMGATPNDYVSADIFGNTAININTAGR